MARKIDDKIVDLAKNYDNNENPIKFFKRFLDDIFMLFRGSLHQLHSFLEELNEIHPTIKFTMNHTLPYLKENNNPECDCGLSNSLAFLDTSCQISDGNIIVDLYRKPTDRNQYLLTSSCHPTHVTSNIPFSLALRIVRICSLPEDRDKRLAELKVMLLERDYKPNLIEAAIERAKEIPRTEALKKVVKQKQSKRPVFVVTFDPRLPSINNIVQKHWRTMTKDPYLKQVFSEPPLIAYRRPKNIKDLIIRAKVPSKAPCRPKRKIKGMSKCKGCPYIKQGKMVKATATDFKTEITDQVNCQTENIVYCIECQKCSVQYIGETQRSLQERIAEHRGYIVNHHRAKATGEHFNLPGHQLSDMRVTVVEKVRNNTAYRKQREQMWIQHFNTKYKGLNKKS